MDAERLKAGLDADEKAALAAASVAGPSWKAETYWPEDESRTRTCVRSQDGAFLGEFDDAPDYPDMAAHVARHDPACVLRRVATGRAILALHDEFCAKQAEGAAYPQYAVEMGCEVLDQVVAALASVYTEDRAPA